MEALITQLQAVSAYLNSSLQQKQKKKDFKKQIVEAETRLKEMIQRIQMMEQDTISLENIEKSQVQNDLQYQTFYKEKL